MSRLLAFLLFPTLFGCSGYLVEDIDAFELQILEDYPVGSSVDKLEQELRSRGFRETGPALIASSRDPMPLPICFRRSLHYGFWGGGYRYVCVRLNDNKAISEIEVYQFVAGL